MGDEPNIGRARVQRPPRGQARVGKAVGKARTPENAPTDYIPIGSQEPPPVFVDPTGGRRRWVRRTAYGIGLLLIVALVVIWLSQLGGSAPPPARTPGPSSAAAAR
ncbi:hypothetical protein [Actinoplanes sp. NPDC048796]|uniref:hypothetical protein n=1 Tax=unclassified Actinoplanes TaxID=2626549 RepID=UPI0033C286F1